MFREVADPPPRPPPRRPTPPCPYRPSNFVSGLEAMPVRFTPGDRIAPIDGDDRRRSTASGSSSSASGWPGPAPAGILADWGADVVKIEPPAGDPARSFQRMLGGDLDVNPVFELDNRGKRGIALDLSTERGVEVADRLLAGADVFVTNIRPAALDRLGLGPDETRGAPPPPRLRPHHRLRARRTRRRPGRLRHRRLLGPGRHRRVAAGAGRPAAVPARRHGRPLGRHDRRRHGQRRPASAGPAPAGASWCRRRCCARAPTRSAST